jgi:hypothetical protein
MKSASISAMVAMALMTSCGGGKDVPTEPPLVQAAAAPQSAAVDASTPQSAPLNPVRSFPGNFADYAVSVDAGVTTVRPLQGTSPAAVDPAVTRLVFDDRKVDLDAQGTAGQVYRLYRAAFGRAPDLAGLGYHVAAHQFIGATLWNLSSNFLASPEFSDRYGSLDNTAFVTQLYANVLGRAPDPGGLQFHVDNLVAGRTQRADTLIGFSESPENQLRTAAQVKNGIVYVPMTDYAWPQTGYLSLPNEIAAFSYPASYTLGQAAAQAASDPCNFLPARNEFPASYVGRHVLPETANAPLAPAIVRGLTLKDAWAVANPTFVGGCSGSMRQAFVHTLDRALALGVDTIDVIPWTSVNLFGTAWRIPIPDELHTSTMPDSELVWAAQQAATVGIKLRWSNQILDALGGFRPAPTVENITKFLDAFEPYMIERAKLLQSAGFDAMQISCSCWFPYWMDPGKSLMEARMAVVAPKLREVFKGKLIFEHTNADTDATLRANVDYNLQLLFPGMLPLTDDDKQNPSVPMFRKRILEAMQGVSTVADMSKPMIWRLAFPSRTDALTTGYLEETFCTAGFDTVSGFDSACLQRSRTADFSLQALFEQAALEAIAQQTWFQTHAVEVDYWMTDSVQPSTTFPNLATSVRNKPAEAILRAWYAR